MKGLFVTGTDTNIGKTWVGVSLISALIKSGINVTPRKPIESGWDKNSTNTTDAWLLANAANKLGELDSICPNHFSQPISPVRAAVLEGKQISLNTLKQQCQNLSDNNEFMFVEGAGGFYSPLCFDGLNADLASALALPILLVAENRLGCINQVLLNVEAIEKRGLTIKAIILNDISNQDSTNMDNHADLTSLVDYPIISIQHNQKNVAIFKHLATLITQG